MKSTKNIIIYILYTLTIMCSCHLQASAQNAKYTLGGYIEDASSSERLIGATVYDRVSTLGTTTNEYGFFSLTLPAGEVDLLISYVGYQEKLVQLSLEKDISVVYALGNSIIFDEIVITAEEEKAIQEKTQMSQMSVPVKQLKAMPVILGETDILKSLQLLPGVQSGGEAQTGLYVRGGSPDQNLVLLDGVPIYNVSHLLGLFSVFNADAIKTVTLTKGGFPARYGGRLSSILDIRMKEGNLNEFHGEGSIGLISSRLTLEGPINKGKTSFLISGRRTYADLIAKPFIKNDNGARKPKLHFYDLNGKIQHKISDKHRIYLSGYLGSDDFGFEDKSDFNRDLGEISWGNYISSLRWNWEVTPKLFVNTTATLSNYDIDIFAQSAEISGDQEQTFSAKYLSGIRDFGGKIDVDFIPNPKHYIKAGFSGINHTYKPGAVTINEISIASELDTLLGEKPVVSTELDAYIEDDITIGNLKVNLGLHASVFNTDSTTYASLQPRLGLRYKFNKGISFKASYSEMTQFINLLTNESLSLPTDLWVPSTASIKPQRSKLYAAGLATTIKGDYEVSLEGYYKTMTDVISYKEGASFIFGLEDSWQDKVTQGDGESYGVELFVQKNKGRLTGWIGYTLSWNWRQFDDINNGDRFPFRFDRRHDIAIVGSYRLSDKISMAANWTYGTGNAITINTKEVPSNFFSDQFPSGNGSIVNELYIYGPETSAKKNAYRMSDFHRLDLSITFHKKKKNFERSWVIGIYNTYGRKNPFLLTSENEFSVDDRGNFINEGKVFKEVSILRFIPSVSYNFKF